MDHERRHILRLNLTGRVTLRQYRRIVERFGSVAEALRAPLAALAAVKGIGPDTAAAIHVVRDDDVDRELERAEGMGAQVIAFGEPAYPARLREITDAPIVLYVLGELRPNEPAVAMVGARRATPYGRRMAETIARDLARSAVCVVSGLARGIDSAAHRGALTGGGRTIAVLGSGLDRCYPEEHLALFREIAAQGAVVTEFPLGTQPLPYHFPRRNRIVAGLADALCVVEAAEKSGSLITVEWALEQGKDVFAVPHRADDPGAAGVHRLIRSGAGLVTGAADLIAALGLGPHPAVGRETPPPAGVEPDGTPSGLNALEAKVYALLEADPKPIDDLIEEAELPASTVFATLTMLELKRVARGWPGRLYQRA